MMKGNNKTGVFIDGSNMLWGSKKSGIIIDWTKLIMFIKEKHPFSFFNYYACIDNNPKNEVYLERSIKQKKFLKSLEKKGFNVIRKELKHISNGETKCDMDVDITLDIREFEDEIDCIVFLTGDSDFLPVMQYYLNKGKKIEVFSFEELLSWELREFCVRSESCKYVLINNIKNEINYNYYPLK